MLRCYAVYDTEISYCQGMNFVAGFFYMVYHDESVAFSLFATLMDVVGIKGFYLDGVPLTKQFIYQMNRLIALYLPQFHTHLNECGINSAFCCSSWFLTSFCYVLQYSNSSAVPSFLLGLFDLYLFVRPSVK